LKRWHQLEKKRWWENQPPTHTRTQTTKKSGHGPAKQKTRPPNPPKKGGVWGKPACVGGAYMKGGGPFPAPPEGLHHGRWVGRKGGARKKNKDTKKTFFLSGANKKGVGVAIKKQRGRGKTGKERSTVEKSWCWANGVTRVFSRKNQLNQTWGNTKRKERHKKPADRQKQPVCLAV